MEICRQNDALEVRELDPFLAELLRQIPASTEAKESSPAEERLFSAPAAGQQNDICAEWKLYVVPELRKLFQSATETVRQDLEQLKCTKKTFANCRLRIPLAHADAWLSALNQARLAIAANYQFTERELSDHYRSPLGSRRDLGLFQVNFYGFLQEFILRETSAP
jgi:Domain of unknown function (DUF2017)